MDSNDRQTPHYPLRSRRQSIIADLREDLSTWIAGRLIPSGERDPGRREECGGLLLRDASGRVPLAGATGAQGGGGEIRAGAREARAGDLVDLQGVLRQGVFEVHDLVLLAPGRVNPPEGSLNHSLWRAGQEPFLRRSLTRKALREFFEAEGFWEVETPTLVPAAGQEPHLQPFETEVATTLGPRRAFLITSPEYGHKRLLAAGHEKIFEITRAYRNGCEEGLDLHWYEFCMLEWYRAYACYEEIMADTENLLWRLALDLRPASAAEFKPPFRRITVEQAFGELAGVDLVPFLDGDAETFAGDEARAGRFGLDPQDSSETRFFKILVAGIEPALARMGPVFLVDYPASQAALSKLKSDDDRLCERFELYVNGVELANGFTELNDPQAQRRRFEEEARARGAAGGAPVPVDEAFLEALELGMPPAGGVALGVDRLILVIYGEESLDRLLPFGRHF